MAEYIEREAVIDLITRRYECPEICTAEINSIPAADVVEVKRGRWVKDAHTKPSCSVCGVYSLFLWSDHKKCNYCPNCGARMEVDNEAD